MADLGSPSHLPITGEDGELIDLFIALVDQAPAAYPDWWYDLGVTAGLCVSAVLRPEAGRDALMDLLRGSLRRIVLAGAEEAFLIRSLVRDVDEYVDRVGDTAAYDAGIDRMRAHLVRIIDDPEELARWRRIREAQDPNWVGRSDEELIADAREGYERFGGRYATPDEAVTRWSLREEWRRQAAGLLSPTLYEHWTALNAQRAMHDQS